MTTNVKSKVKKVLAMLAVFWIVAESLYGQTQLYEQYKIGRASCRERV